MREAEPRCLAFSELDSTNAEARRRAEAGARGPLWIRADRQSAGRGRRGRSWVSEAGNLHATLLFAPGRGMRERPQLSFVAALALHDAVARLVGESAGLRCKWPNDLLADGRKLAGILLEGEADWLAVGFGLNLVHHPRGLDQPATSLSRAFGVTVTAETAWAALAESFSRRYVSWERSGFGPVREAWKARARGLGEVVSIHLAVRTITGRMRDLDADGALLLERPDGTLERVTAGDVVLG